MELYLEVKASSEIQLTQVKATTTMSESHLKHLRYLQTKGSIGNFHSSLSLNFCRRMCLWSIQVADREHILLEFLEFDLENDTQCHSDHLTVYVDEDRRIGGINYGFVVVLPSASSCEGPCFLVTLFNRSILWWSTSISDSYWWFPQYHSAVCV